MPTARLTLSIDASYDWLTCQEFGFVDDGIPNGCWEVLIDDRVALIRHPHSGEIVGFTVVEWATFDASEHGELFAADQPGFAVPQLGLPNANVGEICLAAKAWLGDEPTLDRAYFHMAMAAPDSLKAIETWLLCLEAGEAASPLQPGLHLLRAWRLQEGLPPPACLHRARPLERLGLVLVRQGLHRSGRASKRPRGAAEGA